MNTSEIVRLLAEPAEGVPNVIDTPEAFFTMVEQYADAEGPLAADAERASGFRYGQHDWLVQFKRSGAPIALVDPVALSRQGVTWESFNDAIDDSPWIIHDSLQDLPGFTELGMRPQALIDTEFSARLLGHPHFGLSAMTEHYLGVSLAKEHSSADWSYRPLGRDLRNYAALDVEVLIELAAAILEDLKRQGKREWAREEFAYLLEQGTKPKTKHPEPWRKISHITKINKDPRGLAIARALWYVRDEYAQDLDIAPLLLLSDAAILDAAVKKPRNSKSFEAIRSLNQRVRIHTGDGRDKMFERYAPIQRKVKPAVWKNAIKAALDLRDDELPTAAVVINKEEGNAPRSMKHWREHHPERFEKLSKARRVMIQIGEDTHTPAEVLLKPQILKNLCWRSNSVHNAQEVNEFLTMQGARQWQVSLLSESLSQVIM